MIDRQLQIQAANDLLRTTLNPKYGKVMMTASVAALPDHERAAVFAAVKAFTAFNEDNDPHKEHDCAIFEVGGTKYMFKLDYMDKAMEYGSSDPSNFRVTTRVLTIMRCDEY